jgi:hypothetical protein
LAVIQPERAATATTEAGGQRLFDLIRGAQWMTEICSTMSLSRYIPFRLKESSQHTAFKRAMQDSNRKFQSKDTAGRSNLSPSSVEAGQVAPLNPSTKACETISPHSLNVISELSLP